MKKTILILLLMISFVSCTTVQTVKNENRAAETENKIKTASSWSYFSEGLYYKNVASGTENADERNALLDKAIERMNKALDFEESKGRIYYHLSDLYYMKGEIAKSEEYAKLSLDADRNFFPPYNRLYSILMNRKQYNDAAAILEKYKESVPDDPNALYMLGVHYFKYLNNTDKSITEFEKIIAISRKQDVQPYYLENSYYNAGYIMYSKGDYRSAFLYFKKAYELNEGNMNSVYMLALSSMGYYDIKDAEKYSTVYLKNTPGEPNMEYILGSVYYINGDDRALEHLSKIRNLKTFEGLVAAGLYYEITGEDAKADSIFGAVMKYRNDLVCAYMAIAKIKSKSGNVEEAYKAFVTAGTAAFRNQLFSASEKMFYSAMDIKKDNKEIYYYLARTHEENRNYSIAISYYNKYYSFSGETDILVHIGYLYGVQGKYGRAYDYFKKASGIEPENSSPYFFTGLVKIWEEQYRDAKESITLAIAKKGTEETYYFYLAVADEKLGEVDAAIESLKSAIKNNPSSGRAYNYLGYIYAEKNINIEEALELVKKALEYEPENGAYLDSLGWIYYRKGEYEQALKYLLTAEEKLAEADSSDFVVYDHIGDTYIKLGNKNSARSYWEKALKMEKNPAVAEKLKNLRDTDENEKKTK